MRTAKLPGLCCPTIPVPEPHGNGGLQAEKAPLGYFQPDEWQSVLASKLWQSCHGGLMGFILHETIGSD